MIEQQYQHHSQSCHYRPKDLRNHNIVDLCQTAGLDTYPFRQVGDMRLYPFLHFFLRRHLARCASQVRPYSNRPHGIAALQRGMMPVGLERSHLP